MSSKTNQDGNDDDENVQFLIQDQSNGQTANIRQTGSDNEKPRFSKSQNMKINHDSTFDVHSKNESQIGSDAFRKLSEEKKWQSSLMMREEIKQALIEQEAVRESILEEFE